MVVRITRCCAWNANDSKKNSAIAGSAGSIQKSTGSNSGLLNMVVAICSLKVIASSVAGITAVAIQRRPRLSFSCAKESVP